MRPRDHTPRKGGPVILIAVGVLSVAAIGCGRCQTRTPEQWDAVGKQKERLLAGASAEHQVDRAINDVVEMLAATMYPSYTEEDACHKLAVLEMSDINRNGVRVLDAYISEKFVTFSFMNRNIGDHFSLVERFLLENVVAELKFNQSGYIDAATAKQLGKIYGVDVIAEGVVTVSPTKIDINARIVETERGTVIAVASAKVDRTPPVNQWLGERLQHRWKRVPTQRSY